MLRPKSIFAIILLTLSFLSGKAQGRILGYSFLQNKEALRTEENNGIVVGGLGPSPNRDQLGSGLYISNQPSDLPDLEGGWYCIITTKRRIDRLGKVFIPRVYDSMVRGGETQEQGLWGEDDKVIVDYIRYWVLEPEKALRFSWVQNDLNPSLKLIMVVPTKVLEDADLDLRGICFLTRDKLMEKSNKVIDWESWGIIGYRQHPV
ncbi:hypothetical protein LZ554_005355 [Drepanopeziza brunnea f. sp. 'monogermtubi']|nr:hypothetical protein LZ554_005355 [Drepanopeziza brunnea f. sp. 'monogermtubi']